MCNPPSAPHDSVFRKQQYTAIILCRGFFFFQFLIFSCSFGRRTAVRVRDTACDHLAVEGAGEVILSLEPTERVECSGQVYSPGMHALTPYEQRVGKPARLLSCLRGQRHFLATASDRLVLFLLWCPPVMLLGRGRRRGGILHQHHVYITHARPLPSSSHRNRGVRCVLYLFVENRISNSFEGPLLFLVGGLA